MARRSYKSKRIFDLCTTIILLVVLFPILLVISLIIVVMIWRYDKGSPLYFQTRVGQNGKYFQIIKFRTMIKNAEEQTGPIISWHTDNRMITGGYFLRRTRLDELPQLINILLGDMSLVGPRPERPEIIQQIKASVPNYDDRLVVKPGIAGVAQVYNPHNTHLRYKLQYDMIYIHNMCICLDIKLLLLSIVKVLTNK